MHQACKAAIRLPKKAADHWPGSLIAFDQEHHTGQTLSPQQFSTLTGFPNFLLLQEIAMLQHQRMHGLPRLRWERASCKSEPKSDSFLEAGIVALSVVRFWQDRDGRVRELPTAANWGFVPNACRELLGGETIEKGKSDCELHRVVDFQKPTHRKLLVCVVSSSVCSLWSFCVGRRCWLHRQDLFVRRPSTIIQAHQYLLFAPDQMVGKTRGSEGGYGYRPKEEGAEDNPLLVVAVHTKDIAY